MTRKDYGFDRAATIEEESKLLGMYTSMSTTKSVRSFSICIQVSLNTGEFYPR